MSILGNPVNLGFKTNATLVWTNPDTTVAFAPTTIAISNPTKYDYFLITGKFSIGDQSFVNPAFCEATIDAQARMQIGYGGNNRCGSRIVTCVESGLSFGDASYNSSEPSNNYCIPVKIYGIIL